MSGAIWDPFLTPRDREVFRASGYRKRQGYGKRPALLIIDVTYDFCGDRPLPILESIAEWKNSCGEDAWRSIASIKELISHARLKGLPIIYTKGGRRPDGWDSGSWRWKFERGAGATAAKPPVSPDTIVPEIAPEPQDIVVEKRKPSAFHGTPLASFLVLLQADSLIVAGGTTSGCVRASVVDAFSDNYRVALVEECCFDRSEASHAMSLCDIDAKYADVVKLQDAVAFVDGLPEGLFELPRG